MKLSVEDWRLLFDKADRYSDASPEEREALLAQTDRDSPALGIQLRSLVQQLDAEDRQPTGHELPAVSLRIDTHRLVAGQDIGPYRLLREIGRGGMSEVWLAERRDGIMRRPLALKLPRSALHDTATLDRFAREREILASLTHPSIARLYDAGVDAHGQPYLAMEYVEGTSLLQAAATRRFTIAERLELFVQVLSAVSHAHAQLIIHRDLKPSNILVDEQGGVHLLDFGIAKLLVEGATESSELTLHVGNALTPDYASPEQVMGEPLSVATDVYSAGVVLFELLCGRRPYHLTAPTRRALEDSILGIVPPSLASAASEEQALACRLDVGSLARELSGDLDAIVQKALKKGPAERYISADAFAADLRRYLRKEPILARPDSVWYRTGRFLRRNWLGAAAVTAIFAALVIGMMVALAQTAQARLEARRADAVQAFLLNLFTANSVDQADPVKARKTTAEELLNQGAKRVAEDLKDSPEAQARVLETLGDMYYQLGLEDRATELHRQRVDVLKGLYGQRDPRVIQATLDYAMNAEESSRRDLAAAPIQAVKAVLDAEHDYTSPLRGRLLLQMARYYRLSDASASRGYADGAIEIFTRDDPNDNLIESLRYGGHTRRALDDWEGMLTLIKRAQQAAVARHPGEEAWLVAPLCESADAENHLFWVEAADADNRDCIAMETRLNGSDHSETRLASLRMAIFLQATSRTDEAHRLLKELHQAFEQAKRPHHTSVDGNFILAALTDGRPDLAAADLPHHLEDLRANYASSATLAGGLVRQAQVLSISGDYAQAEQLLTEALTMIRKAGGSEMRASAENGVWLARARMALDRGDRASALDAIAQVRAPAKGLALREWDAWNVAILRARALLPGPSALTAVKDELDAVNRSAHKSYLGSFETDLELTEARLLLESGDFARASEVGARAVAKLSKSEDPHSIHLAEARIGLANARMAAGDFREAESLLKAAAADIELTGAQGDPYAGALKSALSRLEKKHP